ncbi:ligand-binding sensor domain-containing protein [Chryseosolibacter indicus]|uniref:Two component regulator three y domain-containing protein n=1 Tax=Chryseosolibacter indicus TaxID=2782351 RepID=A0ABS5VX52_9BACT|nr:triple tyrosine motif-containing protein [Chryseosolibacter indicus]MBT1705992.1 two component regulator three y domain-containing protein [Chryseosolibacter indicus]
MSVIFLRVTEIVFILLPFLANGQEYGTPFIRNYTTEEFNGGIQSWNIVQDNQEIIYIANNFGLLQFDGTFWNIHPVRNGTKIRSVLVGSDQKIYVGSQADFGYFSPNAYGTLQYYSLADSLPSKYRNFDEVWRIYEKDGSLYFFTFKNIYVYAPGSIPQTIEPKYPLEFSFLVNKQFYTLQWGHGLSMLEGNELKLIPGGDFFAKRQIASILPLNNTNILIFTIHDGIYIHDGLSIKKFAVEETPIITSSVINQAIMLKDGTFALGTQNNGLVIINREGKLVLHIDRENGLLDQTVHGLYQDVHENLWLGLNNSISMIELSSPFSFIDNNVGLIGTGYSALQVGSILYLGTNTGLFYWDQKASKRHFELVPNSAGQVYKLTSINGHILMGHHNGPYEIINKKAQLIYPERGAWEFVSFPRHNDYIVMGSYTGLSLLQIKDQKIHFKHKFKSFEESSRVLEFDDKGDLWMAHGYKGIYKLKVDRELDNIKSIRFYNSHDGLPSDYLNNMEVIDNRLIFPASQGIYKYEQDKFVPDAQYSTLFPDNEHIVEMEQDVLGNIYFITRPKVGKILFDKFGKATTDTQVFNKIKDLLNDDLGIVRALDADNILFGAKKGFIHYNAAKRKDMPPYQTHLRKVLNTSTEKDSLLLEGTKLYSDNELVLPYKLNSLRFVYSSSFYENPEKTEYQFYLENFDQGWSSWIQKTEKEYTNLPEGEYTFHVRSRNIYSTISEAKAFTFTVLPPFYRSSIAYVLYSISAMFLFVMMFQYLNKRFKKEKNLILLNKEQELHKKDTEIKEIADQSEQQIVKLRNEKLQSEVDHMNRELASSTIHLINKNELLNTVKRNLEDLIKKKDFEKPQDDLQKIIHNIDQNLSSDNDWKQFELHFNNVHGNFTNRLLEKYPKLTPQEVKLSAYLRLNLNTKEIAHLLNISVRGVEISRYRLRKKLLLDRNENLTDFMLKF